MHFGIPSTSGRHPIGTQSSVRISVLMSKRCVNRCPTRRPNWFQLWHPLRCPNWCPNSIRCPNLIRCAAFELVLESLSESALLARLRGRASTPALRCTRTPMRIKQPVMIKISVYPRIHFPEQSPPQTGAISGRAVL